MVAGRFAFQGRKSPSTVIEIDGSLTWQRPSAMRSIEL
jgi:hypothetical protein